MDVAIKNTIVRTLEVIKQLDRAGKAMAACADHDLTRILCWLPESPEILEHREDILGRRCPVCASVIASNLSINNSPGFLVIRVNVCPPLTILSIMQGTGKLRPQLLRNRKASASVLTVFVECFNYKGNAKLEIMDVVEGCRHG